MATQKILIIGYGYVGKAYHKFFESHYETKIFDPFVTQSELSLVTSIQAEPFDLYVVCTPTPAGEKGECDLTAVHETLADIPDNSLVLIKSTVEVGTTDYLKEKHPTLKIVFSPENIGESTYYTPAPYDFHVEVEKTPWFTFGGEREDTTAMVNFFMPITGPAKRYNQCTPKEAEMAKYMNNTSFAMRVVFVNEIARICNEANIDFNTVRELWLCDPRNNPMFSGVITNRNDGMCFGGKCLPKDLSALICFAEKAGYDAKFLREIQSSNKRIGQLNGENQ